MSEDRAQILNLLLTVGIGAMSAAAKAIMSAGVDASEVEAAMQDALAQMTVLKQDLVSMHATHAAQWAELHAALGLPK